MKPVQFAGIMLAAMWTFAVQAGTDIEARYNSSCMACHASGAAGAPISFDEEVWESRLAKGMDMLLLNVKKGVGAMPPKGICFDCTDEEFKALINYMSSPKG